MIHLNDIKQRFINLFFFYKFFLRPLGIPFVFELIESARDWIHHNLIDFIDTHEEEKVDTEVYYRPQFETFTLVNLKFST